MPPADYRCRRCGHTLTVTSRPTTIPCTCGHHHTRVWQPTPTHLNGPGYYTTDNRRG